MKNQDLLAKFPEKFFSERFEDKEVAIKGIETPEGDVLSKKAEFRKIFEFDNLMKNLKGILEESPEKDIDEYSSERISFLLSQLSSIISYLNDGLNYSEPRNINRIFERFQQNTSYLFQEVLINRAVSNGKQVIDEYIGELKQIIRNIDHLAVDEEKLIEAEKVATKLIRNAERYDKAAVSAEGWIKSEGRALSSSLQDKEKLFNNKSEDDHNTKKIWGWFVGGIIGGLVALGFIIFFIVKGGTNVSLGSALLRISTLIIISYFALYCLQNFSSHRKLYEVYKFKAIALKTMEELLKSYTEAGDREKILNKAMNVIFSEPNVKEDKIVQQRILDETFDTLKKKIDSSN